MRRRSRRCRTFCRTKREVASSGAFPVASAPAFLAPVAPGQRLDKGQLIVPLYFRADRGSHLLIGSHIKSLTCAFALEGLVVAVCQERLCGGTESSPQVFSRPPP
jgi:hypothetical protein